MMERVGCVAQAIGKMPLGPRLFRGTEHGCQDDAEAELSIDGEPAVGWRVSTRATRRSATALRAHGSGKGRSRTRTSRKCWSSWTEFVTGLTSASNHKLNMDFRLSG